MGGGFFYIRCLIRLIEPNNETKDQFDARLRKLDPGFDHVTRGVRSVGTLMEVIDRSGTYIREREVRFNKEGKLSKT